MTTVECRIPIHEKFSPLLEPHTWKIALSGRSAMKCLALGTKVIMADGTLRAVEDVRVGDAVLGPDSRARHVLSVSRGHGPLYRVQQASGMTYTVNDTHLLSLKKSESSKKDRRVMENGNPRNSRRRYPDFPDIVHMTPVEWIQQSQRWKQHFRGFKAGCIHFEKQDLGIDPYLLGVWLGDGTARELRITSADHEVIEYCRDLMRGMGGDISLYQKAGQRAYDIGLHFGAMRRKGRKNPLWRAFKAYNLKNNKHIPHAFLVNSEENRLSLLAGLIDSDGTASHNGYVITQCNESLARQIKYLADLLGFKTNIVGYATTCGNNGVRSWAWRVSIDGDTWRIPCKIARKRLTPAMMSKRRNWLISGLQIDPVGDGEWAGFEIDGDHQFLLEDGTVTHNSWQFARGLLWHMTKRFERVLCTREVQKSLRESVHKLLSDQIEILNLGKLFDVQQEVIYGPNGSSFVFAGLSDQTAESIKSFEGVTKCWVEEARSVTPRSWRILTATIFRVPGSEIWVSFNPLLDTDEAYQMVLNPPENSVVIRSSYLDNPWHSKEQEAERLRHKASLPKDEYENIWEGKVMSSAPGSVYAREVGELVSQGRYVPMPYDSRLKVHTIWDMGWNVCSIILVQRNRHALYIIGYLEGTHIRTEEWATLLNHMSLNWGYDWIPHDAYSEERKTGMTDYDILRNHKRRVKPREQGIPEIPEESGVRVLRQVFPRIYIHKGGDELIPTHYRVDGGPMQRASVLPGLMYHNTARLVECLKRYRYAIPRQGEPQHPIADEYEHACDAMRYLACTAERLSNEDEWSGRSTMPRGMGFGVSADRGLGGLG